METLFYFTGACTRRHLECALIRTIVAHEITCFKFLMGLNRDKRAWVQDNYLAEKKPQVSN